MKKLEIGDVMLEQDIEKVLYSEEEIIDITLGSCAVPYIFPPVSFVSMIATDSRNCAEFLATWN